MQYENIIRENKNRLFLYMLGMTAIIVALGHIISQYLGYGLMGTGISLIFAGGLNFISYFFSDSIVIKSTGAQEIKESDLPQYYNLVREMCQRNNIHMPRLYIINSQALNAFATGRNREKSIVAVTKGLLEKLTPEEISGVVGHELSHIEHGDILLMSAISILAGFISILAQMMGTRGLNAGLSRRENSGSVAILGIVLALAAPFTATLIKLAISRTREYSADALGAKICGNPQYLASALNKIKYDGNPLAQANDATAHLYISNPFKNNTLANLMSTHPNIDDRIKKLQQMSI